MSNKNVDIAVIGGGPAGLAAAISAKQHCAKHVVIIDRNSWLGGILPQCIHDGFGVEEMGISMTGPEYAEKYIKLAKKHEISFMKETMVLQINKNREIIAVNKKGFHKIKTKVIILAMGCREKTRWSVMIPGSRPSGIYTAGVAQAFINLYNIMPGKNVVILGSGDVGLIIARRLKFEGANVLGVVEILPYASGLPRNVVQCLDDYDIPLFLKHTITLIEGKERLNQVTISKVDKHMNPIAGTEKKISCDTLLLSLGLIPENELSEKIGIEIDLKTGGPIVDQNFETTVDNVFACGNCLQVYDTVDMLSLDAKRTGEHVVERASKKNAHRTNIPIIPGKGIRYVVPQRVNRPGIVPITFRVEKPKENTTFHITSGENELLRKKMRWVNPANMVKIELDISAETISSGRELEVTFDD